MPRFSRRRSVGILIAAIALTIATLPAAKAFTIEDATGTGTSQNLLDLSMPLTAEQGSQFKQRDGMTTLGSGNTSLQFGHTPSFDQQYNPENLFDPLGHPPGVR